MASRNRIGIEVQVEFPSARELQSQLAEKWKTVKNGFTGKINVDVDGTSMRTMKSKIKKALKEDTFDIKIDFGVKQAVAQLDKFKKGLNKIDQELSKKRELKIDIKALDMEKSFREILSDVKKIDNALGGQTKALKSQNHELDAQASKMAKIQRIQKTLKDGTVTTTLKTTMKGKAGREEVSTMHPDGRVDNSITDNREKAIREIQQAMKDVHKIEMKILEAEGEELKMLQNQKSLHSQVLGSLKNEYLQAYKTNAIGDKTIQQLSEQLKMQLRVKDAVVKENKEKSEVANVVSKVAKLEQKKQQLALKILQATEQESAELRKQYDQYDRIQNELKQNHNLAERMSTAQKEELANIRRIGFLERERYQAKQRDLRAQEQMNEKLREQERRQEEALQDLKKIHQIRQQIAKLESRRDNGGNFGSGDREQLKILQEEQKIAQENMALTMRELRQEGLVTKELEEQLKTQSQINRAELERIQRVSRVQSGQDKLNQELKEHERISNQIGQLQRDLVFAGIREEQIIERQIRELEQKQNVLRQSLRTQGALTDSMEREIRATDQARQAQLRLNRARQDAREKDRAFNDTGGLVDPWAFAGNVEQGAMAIFEPVRRLDEALVGVRKVAEATDAQFREFEATSYDVGSSLGVTADEYILAVEKWVTAGKTFTESQELAQTSMIGAFVGNLQPDEMVKYMSVPLNAYKDTMLEANDVINVMNETSNNHAIEMVDLGKAYVRSAATAKDAGISYGYLTGMITGAQEATRKGGERIGTGLKTISMNMGNIFAQMTKGEQRKFNFFESIGVDFADNEGKMLSGTEILQNLVDVWDELSAEDKTTAKFYMAGKEHAETLSAVINEWDRVQEVAKETDAQMGLGEEGSAFLEHAKQADSVKFKLAELKNAWDKLMHTLGNGSGGVADVMSVLINGLQELNNLASNDKLMDTLKWILAGVALHAGANLYRRFFDTIKTGLGGMRRDLRETGRLMNDFTGGRLGRNGNQASGTSGVGGIIATGGINRNGANNDDDRNRTAGNNSNSDNDRDRESLNRDIDETDQRIRNTNGALRTGMQLGGKLLGLVPLLGDILIIGEILGFDVFGKAGKAIDAMVTSTKELNNELEKATKKQLASNMILNGEATANDKAYGEVGETFKTSMKDEIMSQDEFFALQEQFNALADKVGAVDENGVAIEVTMNDTAHIEEKLAQLKQYLLDIKKEELVDVGEGINKSMGKIDEARATWGEQMAFIEEYNQQIKNHQAVVDELEKKKKENPFGMTDSDYSRLSSSKSAISDYQERIKFAEEQIEGSKSVIETATEGIGKSAYKLVDYLAKGGELANMGIDKEALKTMLGEMITQYNGYRDSINLAGKAQKELNDKNAITKDTWRAMQEEYPRLASISVDEVNKKKDIRSQVSKIIEEEKKKKQTQADAHKQAIDASAKEVGAKVSVEKATGKVSEAVDKTGKKWGDLSDKLKDPPQPKITIWMSIAEKAKHIWNKLFGGGEKSVSVTANVKEGKSESVSSASSISSNAVKSASISSTGGGLVKTPATVASIDSATSSKSSASTNANARVNSDVWRYWGTEMKIEDVTQSINRLTGAIQNASENQAELIKLYTQQNKTLRAEESLQNALARQKQSEMSEVLKKLRGYGFKTKGNDVTNLSHSKNLKGDKATQAEELLNTWRALGTDLTSISERIASLNETIKDNNEAMEKAKIAKELEAFEKTTKRIEAILTKVGNSEKLTGQRLSLLDEGDKELGLVENEKALNESKANLSALIVEFNKLSKATIAYEENGTSLEANLQSLGTEILAQADAVLKYQQAINDLEISRVTEDLNEFSSAVDKNSDKIANNIENLKEGLLSGTDINDLQSSKSSSLDLDRDNRYEKLAQERINLEKEVQDALAGFAKKNIDREKGVANTTLDINSKMYNQMLKMAKDYTAGRKATYSQIVSEFDDLSNIGLVDEDYGFVKELDDFFTEVQKKQDEITKKYHDNMAKAVTADDKESLTNQYIIDSLKVQEEYFQATIKANQEAINELKSQLNDPSLTDAQEEEIQKTIAEYEESITEAQNNIKDTIQERFEFEFGLLEEALSKYEKYNGELEYSMDILEALGGSNFGARGALLDEMLNNEKERNSELQTTLSTLEQQLGMYEEGSFEWNLINEQVEEYKKLLQDSNLELIEMNQNIMSNSFESTFDKIQRAMLDGKSVDELERYQELWMDGLEREIALEDTYQRLADLGTKIHDEKMTQLAKQEKLSRFEMEYLNKQLDVLELQQKLENLNKERNIQTLKQQADGTWDWEYVADADQISQTQKELAEAELALQQAEEDARKDYLSQLEELLGMAEEGEFGSVEEFQDALADLGEAFESIVGDMPEIQEGYIQDLINAYQQYLTGNNDVSSVDFPREVYEKTTEGVGNELAKAFGDVSKDLGESFADALIAKIPSLLTPVEKHDEDRMVNIHLDKIEFPNIKTADGIKEAILNLPKIALQKAREK